MARKAARWLLALFFVIAGANHFLNEGWYLRIMPAWIPLEWHAALVRLSGAGEMALGAALLPQPTRGPARWGLAALLLAIFPANVEMAAHPERFRAFKPAILWARLPLQFLLIALVWWAARPDPSPRSSGAID